MFDVHFFSFYCAQYNLALMRFYSHPSIDRHSDDGSRKTIWPSCLIVGAVFNRDLLKNALKAKLAKPVLKGYHRSGGVYPRQELGDNHR